MSDHALVTLIFLSLMSGMWLFLYLFLAILNKLIDRDESSKIDDNKSDQS